MVRSDLPQPPLAHRLKLRLKRALGLRVILCDTCQWDWRSACHNPQRPNATWCLEYARRGQ